MFPKGGMQGLVKQAQDMQKKMKKMEEELKELRIKGSASGKLVVVEADGKKNIISIKIETSFLEYLIAYCINFFEVILIEASLP